MDDGVEKKPRMGDEIPYVHLSFRTSVRSPKASGPGLWVSQLGLRANWPGFRANGPGLKASLPGLRSCQLDGWMGGQTDVGNFSPFYRTSSSIGATTLLPK